MKLSCVLAFLTAITLFYLIVKLFSKLADIALKYDLSSPYVPKEKP